MNTKFKQYLATIQKEWMDPKVVASSYAAYIDSKIQIASEIRNSIYQSISLLESLPLDSNVLNDIQNGVFTEEAKQLISHATGYDFGNLMNICVPTTDGDLVQFKEILSSYAKSIKTDSDAVTCTSLNGRQIPLSDILDSLNSGVDLNFAISSALDGYANDKTPADYLSELSANLGDRFSNVSSYASKAFNILKDGSMNVIDKIQTLVNPITEFDDESVSGNFIRSDVNTSMYTGVSPAVFWFDANLNGVEAVADLYIKSLKLSWKITVAIFKVVTSMFVGIWNKFLRGLFITDDIIVNDQHNCDYINIPRSQYRFPLSTLTGESSVWGFSSVTDILVQKFGYSSVTEQDIWNAMFNNGYAIDFPTKFGLIRFIKDGDTVVRQVYLIPNTPIKSEDLSWLVMDDGSNFVTTNCHNKSIDDQFNALFVNSKTEDINVTKNDTYYWRAFQVSIARMDFLLGLISTSFMLNDSDYTDTSCTALLNSEITLAGLFGSEYPFSGNNNTKVLGYLSPSSNYNFNAAWTNDQVSLLNITKVPSSNPSNADFLILLANGSLDVHSPDDMWLLADFPVFSCWSVIAYIYATTKYGMSQLAGQGGQINSVTFFPYQKSNKNDFEFKYTLASDSYNQAAFDKRLKVTATTILVVAATFVVFKGLKQAKAKALTNLQKSQAAMWDRINKPDLTKEELATLQNNLYKANKKYNRVFGVSSSLNDLDPNTSDSDVQSILKVIK